MQDTPPSNPNILMGDFYCPPLGEVCDHLRTNTGTREVSSPLPISVKSRFEAFEHPEEFQGRTIKFAVDGVRAASRDVVGKGLGGGPMLEIPDALVHDTQVADQGVMSRFSSTIGSGRMRASRRTGRWPPG